MVSQLLETLRELETEMHRQATRADRARLETLLHPRFEEFGRSGQRYSRDDVLKEFSAGGELGSIHAQDFALIEVTDGVALLTYVSAHVDSNGQRFRYSLRSSLWVNAAGGWQMLFHQGTPMEPITQKD